MAKLTRHRKELIESYVTRGFWTLEITSDLWDRNALQYPDKEALVDTRSRLTYAQVRLYSDRFALGLLELGFKKDDILVMQLPNCVENFIVRLGCEKAGVLCGTALYNLRHKEMGYALQHLNATGVVIPWQFRNFDYFRMITELRSRLLNLKHIFVIGEKVPPGAHSVKEMFAWEIDKKYPANKLEKTKFGPFECAVLGITSGTTGMPKFVEHPILARMATGASYGEQIQITHNDAVLCAANVTAGNGGPSTYNGAAPMVGAKVILIEKWDPGTAFELIEQEKPTLFLCVPAQLTAMLKHPDFDRHSFHSLRCVRLSTAVLPHLMVMEWEKKTGVPVIQGYGLQEAGGISGTTLDQSQDERLLTVGKLYRGVRVLIIDNKGCRVPAGGEGEILVEGSNMSSGYYMNPELTRKSWVMINGESWFATGDLGKFDQKGNLILTGRKKDVIIRGGQNVYPEEIEELLQSHPKVMAAALVGMPDTMMGEKVCAYIETKPGEKFTFEEMIIYLKAQKLALYKLPERLEIREKLPRIGFGKIPKRLLREDLLQKLEAVGEPKDQCE